MSKFTADTSIQRKNIVIVIFVAILLLAIFLFTIQKPSIILQKLPAFINKNTLPDRSIYIGFWTQGFWNSQTQTINPQSLTTIENEIGKKVAIANYYQGWEYLSNPQMINDTQTVSQNGWRPMISSNPYFFEQCHANGMTLYKAIANGNCDAFLHKVGQNLSKVKQPFFLRFAWEMNVNSMQWSTIKTGDSPQDFINAWRHIHDIMSQEGVKNIIWVFSPQVETPTTTPISSLYPGDGYVNWVGLDGYNWGTSQSWSSWQNFYTIFYNSYSEFNEIAPSKPLMIAEVNTTDVGGDQAGWYHDMLSDYIPNDFPNIDAVVFFNEDKSSTEGVKWLINNTPASFAEFKSSINNPIYKSHF